MIRKILRKVSFRLSLWQALIFAILAIALSYVTHTLIVEQIRTHEQEAVSFRLSEFTLQYERGGVEAVKALASVRRKRAQKTFFVRLASAGNKTIFLRDPEDWLEFNSDLLRKVPVPTDTRIHWLELNAQDGNALYLAMHRLGGMHEMTWLTKACESCGKFAANQSGLSHAAHHNMPVACAD